jgi:chitodextrinase
LVTTTAGAITFGDTGLSPSTEYCYQVIATNAGGDSPASASDCLTTAPGAPAAPTGLAAVAGTSPSTDINLSWTASAGATDYKVDRCQGTGTGCTNFTPLVTTTAGAITFGDTGLSPSTEYCYQVIATNAGGDSPASASDCLTTGPSPEVQMKRPHYPNVP